MVVWLGITARFFYWPAWWLSLLAFWSVCLLLAGGGWCATLLCMCCSISFAGVSCFWHPLHFSTGGGTSVTWPNQPTPGKAGWASWFHLGHLWPGVPESER